MRYKLNIWNPLTHIFMLLVLIWEIPTCLFTDKKLQYVLYSIGRMYAGEDTAGTTKFAIFLYLVVRTK